MKTTADMHDLITKVTDLFKSEKGEILNKFRSSYEDCMEDCFCYYGDGWSVEVEYTIRGVWNDDRGDYWTPPSCELVSAEGEITSVTAYDDYGREAPERVVEKIRDILDEEIEKMA